MWFYRIPDLTWRYWTVKERSETSNQNSLREVFGQPKTALLPRVHNCFCRLLYLGKAKRFILSSTQWVPKGNCRCKRYAGLLPVGVLRSSSGWLNWRQFQTDWDKRKGVPDATYSLVGYFTLLVGIQTSSASVEVCMEGSQRSNNRFTTPPDQKKKKKLSKSTPHHRDTWQTMFIAALLTMATLWNQLRFLTTEWWFKNVLYLLFTHIKTAKYISNFFIRKDVHSHVFHLRMNSTGDNHFKWVNTISWGQMSHIFSHLLTVTWLNINTKSYRDTWHTGRHKMPIVTKENN